jgi:hypothetical protein
MTRYSSWIRAPLLQYHASSQSEDHLDDTEVSRAVASPNSLLILLMPCRSLAEANAVFLLPLCAQW